MTEQIGNNAAERLRSFIERAERLLEEKAAIAADIKEIYAEAKSAGYMPKLMREIVKLRKMDQSERQELEEILDVYKRALEM